MNQGDNNGAGNGANGGVMPVANGGAVFVGLPVATNATQGRIIVAIQADGVNHAKKPDGSVDVVPYAKKEIRVNGKFVEANAADLDDWGDCKKTLKWARAKEERRLAKHRLESKYRDDKAKEDKKFLDAVLEDNDVFWTTNSGRKRRGKQTGLKEKARRVSRHC